MKFKEVKTIKAVIIVMALVATMIITYVSMAMETVEPVTTTMEEASLPVVMIQSDKGTMYNRMFGYTSEIDASLMRESVTPLPTDNKLAIAIDTYGQNIKTLSYKVRKADSGDLIENTSVKNYTEEDNRVTAVLNIKNMIENDTEYILEINLSTESESSISYYSRMISTANIGLDAKLSFVLDFNQYTFDSENLDKISSWLESKSSADNSNYGKVNINSSRYQVGWGSLNPVVISDIVPTITDIGSEIASIHLAYKVASPGTDGVYDTYNVSEYYRIRQTTSTMYLLNYERETNQIFDCRNDVISAAKLNIGIRSDDNVTARCDDKQVYTAFINEGNLWLIDTKENVFTEVFSFESADTDNLRESYNKHQIKIMKVSTEGNVDFICYGYMNRGEHQGEIGVSLLGYNYKDNIVEEKLFVPVTVPYESMVEKVGQIAYINSNNIFYCLIDNSMYSIDLTSMETMKEIDVMEDGTYCVSNDGKRIAYNLSDSTNPSASVRVIDMESGSEHRIDAAEGDYIKCLGYIDNDLVYGVAHAEDVFADITGNAVFPMHTMYIAGSDYEILKEYHVDGMYVTAIEVDGLRINISRAVKSAGGSFESAAMDQIISKDESSKDAGISVSTTESEVRKKQVVLQLSASIEDINDITMRASKEVTFTERKDATIDVTFANEGRYYVYGFGDFKGSYTSLGNAVSKANEVYGAVVNNKSQFLWKRYKDTSAAVRNISGGGTGTDQSLIESIRILLGFSGSEVDIEGMLAEGKSAIDIINQATSGNALNLRDTTLDTVLYYVYSGIPVIAKNGDNSYVLLAQYDSTNVVYYDTATGQYVTKPLTDAAKIFAQWGNIFLTYRR